MLNTHVGKFLVHSPASTNGVIRGGRKNKQENGKKQVAILHTFKIILFAVQLLFILFILSVEKQRQNQEDPDILPVQKSSTAKK